MAVGNKGTVLVSDDNPGTLGNVPIIALTANTMKGSREKCVIFIITAVDSMNNQFESIEDDCNEYIKKPLSKEVIYKKLSNYNINPEKKL